MQKKIIYYITDYLSDFSCSYRQGFSTIESWRQSLNSRDYSGAVLTDLPEAFDKINLKFLTAKRHVVLTKNLL